MYSDKVWEWKNKEQTAFEALKIVVTTTLVLVLSQDSKPFQIKTNSLDLTTSAVLSQQSMVDGK